MAPCLGKEEILLREIIDLEATYGAENAVDDDESDKDKKDRDDKSKAKGKGKEEEKSDDGDEDEEDGDESNMSLSAMEEELRPQVIVNFKKINRIYKKLSKIQEDRMGLSQKAAKFRKNWIMNTKNTANRLSRRWIPSS